MPLQATSGAASYDAFGGGVAAVPQYIEDVFSTYLYTGNGATGQSIVNGIDLSTKGGLVWLKSRTTPSGSSDNNLYDTVRGASQLLISNSTNAQTTATRLSFQTTGFNLTNEASSTNESGVGYVSWTFRKQPKFFDIQTWTGTGSNRTISHSLGSVPACIMVKRTDTTGGWQVYHRSLANTEYLVLNTVAAVATGATRWNSTTPTSTVFSLGTDATVNASGGTYVAYIFAHDAGGFGLTGTDNVISCGSYTGNGLAAGPAVTLGYEPQWVMIKNATNATPWIMLNNMMGLALTASNTLQANANYIETAQSTFFKLTATGFELNTTDSDVNATGSKYIYIAIRRGPMKVPTSGTSVFGVGTRAGSSSVAKTNSSVLTDLAVIKRYTSAAEYWAWTPRLVGSLTLQSNSADAELSGAMATNPWDTMTGAFCAASNGATNTSTLVDYSFRRAPSFFDVVCYTGTGTSTAFNHNLTVVPEMIITKIRNSAFPNWGVWHNALSPSSAMLFLNTTGTQGNGYVDTVTSTTFSFATANGVVNSSGNTYVAYLFATCPGVSKVGSYTGTGATQTISCGFAGGARFVLIKRTDSTGDWYVWDTARGMVSGTDPSLLLNSAAAEVNANSVYTTTGGFQIVSTAAGINASGGTYIYLAIA